MEIGTEEAYLNFLFVDKVIQTLFYEVPKIASVILTELHDVQA